MGYCVAPAAISAELRKVHHVVLLNGLPQRGKITFAPDGSGRVVRRVKNDETSFVAQQGGKRLPVDAEVRRLEGANTDITVTAGATEALYAAITGLRFSRR